MTTETNTAATETTVNPAVVSAAATNANIAGAIATHVATTPKPAAKKAAPKAAPAKKAAAKKAAPAKKAAAKKAAPKKVVLTKDQRVAATAKALKAFKIGAKVTYKLNGKSHTGTVEKLTTRKVVVKTSAGNVRVKATRLTIV